MNIGLFTDTYYPEINGVANSVYQLKKELEAKGNNVYVFTVSNPYMKEKEHNVYRLRSLPCLLLKERRISCSMLKKWYRIIESLNLDIIHTQTEFVLGHLGRKAAQKFNIPLVHTYHTIYEDYTHYLRIPENENLKGIIRSFSKICCDRADEVIVPTDKVKNILINYGVFKPIVIQPTGIDISKFCITDYNKVQELKSTYNIKPNNHVMISIGRLSKEKNLHEIIEFMNCIVKEDPLSRLIIVGDGPERENLEKQVFSMGLKDYVTFTGEVEWKDVQNYYAIGDVFVCASTSETQGLTYSEALAAGKPLLVREDECLNNIVENGVNGYSYNNIQEFSEKYHKLFDNEEYISLSSNTRQSIENISSMEFGKGIEKIYTDVIDRSFKNKKEHSYSTIA